VHLFVFARFLTRPQHEEAVVTLAMLHIDRARTRMPLVCTAISMLVVAVVGALGFASWLIETNPSAPDFQGANAAHMPQISMPAADASDARESDPYETESWVRHSREF
jgi:nitrate reductase NapE component